MSTKLWGLKGLFNIGSIYLIFYVFNELFENLTYAWWIPPTWIVMFGTILIINLFIWLDEEQDAILGDAEK